MPIPENGLTREQVLEALREYKDQDLPWQSGKVMAFVYDPGQEVQRTASEAYMMYLGENGLDPTTFPSVMKIEREVVRMIIDLAQGDDAVVGNMTSGGTESNLVALKSARDWALKERPEITQPEIILSRTAHPSFHKACVYFGLKPVIVGFDPVTFHADVDAMRKAVTPNTIALIASAPGYAQGVVDSVPEIAALAQEHGLWCHVDGCVGGIHLSFMRKLGYDVPPFDFSVPGVTSLSADMHKFGYAPKNASIIMFRNKELRKHQYFACILTTTYVLINPGVLSTKTGGPMAASWATLMSLGQDGYSRIVREVQEATEKLTAGVAAIPGLRVLGTPDMCLFSFTSDEVNLFHVADEMKTRGWYLQPQFSTEQSPYNLHITVNHSSVSFVDALLADLRASMDAVRAYRNPIEIEVMRRQINGLIAGDPENAAETILGLAGIDDNALPAEMALINTVLEVLPDPLAEELLIGYINELYH